MFCESVQQHSVRASFENNEQNQPCIRFFDPSYVRSETILLDPVTRAVHAVLHENAHFIGHIPAEMLERFVALEDIYLLADHYSGKPVSLRAPVAVQRG